MPLDFLFLHASPVKDLSPLASIPLKLLEISPDSVTDFGPLREVPIEEIALFDVEHTGLTPAQAEVVRPHPTIKTINGKPKDEFWKDFDTAEKPKPGE